MGCELIRFENGATAIVCGLKKDHECDSNGPVYAISRDGTYFDIKDRPDWDFDPEGYEKWMEGKNITGGCVSCSICEEPFSPPMF